uniref:Uncharacterized protein n=1 Tax=Mola mola TaxID=94237 RepID=A0A3Q3WQF4_MOLML
MDQHLKYLFDLIQTKKILGKKGTRLAFEQGKSLPFINPSSLETLRALVQEIQNSGETDPEIWKDCEVRKESQSSQRK